MKTPVERVRDLCKEKGIPVSKMEQDLGFGNGYLNPKKVRELKTDRAKTIAEYLDVSLDEILGQSGIKKEPTPENESELDNLDVQLFEMIKSLGEAEKRFLLAQLQTLTAKREERQ